MSDATGAKRDTATDVEERARRRLVWGALLTTFGLAVAGTIERTVGGLVVVVGWLVLVAGVHTFGRAAERS